MQHNAVMTAIPWWLYAFAGALCAGLISIFAKVGMKPILLMVSETVFLAGLAMAFTFLRH